MFKRKMLRLGMVILLIVGLLSMWMDLVQAASSDQKAKVTTESEVDQKLQGDTKGLSIANLKAKINSALNKRKNSKVGTDSEEFQKILDLVVAARTNNKKEFLKITKSKILDDAIPRLSEMSYEDAKKVIIKSIKENLNIDITKGSINDLKAKLLEVLRNDLKDQAQHYGVDITGLSDAEAQEKIEAAKKVMMSKEMEELKKYAELYGVNIEGLSKEDAWAKVKEAQMIKDNNELQAEAQRLGVDITGLTKEEAWKKVKEASEAQMMEMIIEEAKKLGVDIQGLSLQEAKEKVNSARDAKEAIQMQEEAKRYNVDITGLSPEEARRKIRQARADMYGIDITGLSDNDAEMKLKELEKSIADARHKEEQLEWVKQEAARMGIDVSGLSYEDALAKIQGTRDAQGQNDREWAAYCFNVNITGLSPDEADFKILQKKAIVYGLNVSGLSLNDMRQKINEYEIAANSNGPIYTDVFLEGVCNSLGINRVQMPRVIQLEYISQILGVDVRSLPDSEELHKTILDAMAAKGYKMN